MKRRRQLRFPLSAALLALALAGAGSPAVIAQAPTPVRNGAQFPGRDIGAKINAAFAALPGGCGVVHVPAANYSYSTPILKPRCAFLIGDGAGTVLHFTAAAGAAVIVGDTAGPNRYVTGGLRDLEIAGPSASGNTVGLWLGGDPAGKLLPTNDYGDFQTFSGLRITGFGTGIKWGNNAWLENFYSAKVAENGTGISMATASANNNEQNVVFGGAIFNNSVAISNATQLDLVFYGTSFDYNCNGGAGDMCKGGGASIVNTGLRCISCHFEQHAGPFIANRGSAVTTLIGGMMALTATAGEDRALIQIGDGDASTNPYLRLSGIYVESNHAVQELVDYAYGGKAPLLDIAGLQGNGNQRIAALFQTGFQPSITMSYDSWLPGWPFSAYHGNTTHFPQGIATSGSHDAHQIALSDTTAGDGTPNKYLRVTTKGEFQILDSNNSAPILTLDDHGNLSLPGTITATGWAAGGASPHNGAPAGEAPLTGATGPIGGSALAKGKCTSGAATVAGASTAMHGVVWQPAADPQAGDSQGLTISAFVSAPSIVTVRVCALEPTTPKAVTYRVAVVR